MIVDWVVVGAVFVAFLSIMALGYCIGRVLELLGMDPYYNEAHPEQRATRGARNHSVTGPLIFFAACLVVFVIGVLA